MELAVILVLLVIAELVISVWMLARHRLYLKEIAIMRDELTQAQMFYSQLSDSGSGYGVAPDVTPAGSVADMVSQATPDDLAKAQQLLTSLGVKVANDGRE